MKTPGDQRPHCPACGLHEPCKTCGKPRLGIALAPPPPAERTYTREELRDLLVKFGCHHEWCKSLLPLDRPLPCTCGLSAALGDP